MKTNKTTRENIDKLMLQHKWLTPLDIQNLMRLMYETLIIFPPENESFSELSIHEIVGMQFANIALQDWL